MTTPEPTSIQRKARLRIVVLGAVQGVGFRPFVFRLAKDLGLAGWVRNSSQGVFIEVEGSRDTLEQFRLCLECDKPPHSSIQSLEAAWLDAIGYEGFAIRESETGGSKTALVLPDIATCPDCVREIRDPGNRRYRYPFTNCTQCGPRFSIIEALPYDRANTSMKGFRMCPECQAEYDDPRNRRFHAQPNACPVCGPQLELWNTSGASVLGEHEALQAAAEAIRIGQIVTVKGVGGFHLMVDARNEAAVQRLRDRKHREEKPFALMFPSLESVKAVCEVSPLEGRLLCSPEAPIVLLRRISNRKSQLVDAVAPGNPNLGAMLPSNPLHHLLMTELGFPVVATSGNLSDEPICIDENEAVTRLNGIADAFLAHNRPIIRHVDDSIVRVMLGREMILRRARGYAPLPIVVGTRSIASQAFPENGDTVERVPTVLAVGAHLKNSVALAVGPQVFLSQHIGDLETEQAGTAFKRIITDLPRLYDAHPAIIAADLHPDYLSTRIARELTGGADGPLPTNGEQSGNSPALFGVQHHMAHVLSCMADNELQPPVLGVAWDGTGYGLDGTIWGGEFFLVTQNRMERVAQLRSFRLPGGDMAVKEPRRAALGLLHELAGSEDQGLLRIRQINAAHFATTELSTIEIMLRRGMNTPRCCSVGRLFDAVASLAGLRQCSQFEGQAAMELEFSLKDVALDEAYDFPIRSQFLDWSPMIAAIAGDLVRNVSIGRISARFHNAMANAIVQVAQRVRCPRVALSGGCFQNQYLTERTVVQLRRAGFQPHWHQRVPPNDGGIALGQIVAARRELINESTVLGSPLKISIPVAVPRICGMSPLTFYSEKTRGNRADSRRLLLPKRAVRPIKHPRADDTESFQTAQPGTWSPE